MKWVVILTILCSMGLQLFLLRNSMGTAKIITTLISTLRSQHLVDPCSTLILLQMQIRGLSCLMSSSGRRMAMSTNNCCMVTALWGLVKATLLHLDHNILVALPSSNRTKRIPTTTMEMGKTVHPAILKVYRTSTTLVNTPAAMTLIITRRGPASD